MVNYLEILRLHHHGYSQRRIEASTHSSRHTIRDILGRAQELKITYPLDESISNAELEKLLYPERALKLSTQEEPNYPYIHRELARAGVTLTLLWNEYCTTCNASGNTPYMYTQFCEKYRRWARVTRATMRIQHKPGEAMQVDWAGTTIPYFDSITGIESAAYLFVAVLPCSCYTYVEACADMKSENWLLCHAHAYSYFGGATRLLIPDNLKTGVTRNTRYETELNRSYQELAEHYGTAIVPTRVRKPKDKGQVEGTVKFASTWITAALRNRKFFTLQEVQSAVTEKLSELNERPFQKREGCRLSAYLNEEKEFMLPMPRIAYEPAIWTQAGIGNDYLVSDGKNKYSVPFDLIGEQVQIRLTKNTVEIFFHGGRVASHPRQATAQREPLVLPSHMPDNHRKYLNYNAEDFSKWAVSVGEHTAIVVKHFLHSGVAPEQGYKACASLTKLAERYSKECLENASQQVLTYTSAPTIRTISTFLKNRSVKKTEISPSAESYGITRGAGYYGKGGDSK